MIYFSEICHVKKGEEIELRLEFWDSSAFQSIAHTGKIYLFIVHAHPSFSNRTITGRKSLIV